MKYDIVKSGTFKKQKQLGNGYKNKPMMIISPGFFIHSTGLSCHNERDFITFSLDLIVECARLNRSEPEKYSFHLVWVGENSPGFINGWKDKPINSEPAGYRLINFRPTKPEIPGKITLPVSMLEMAQAMLFMEKSCYKLFINEHGEGENPFTTPPLFGEKCLVVEKNLVHIKDGVFFPKTATYWKIEE